MTPSSEWYMAACWELDAIMAGGSGPVSDAPRTDALQALLWDELPRLLGELDRYRTAVVRLAVDPLSVTGSWVNRSAR